MQSVKKMNKKFSGLLSKRDLQGNGSEPGVDSPDANAGRAVRLFCESGSASNPGEEVLHLPVIVENAESSPQAAAAAAYQIRKFLGRENYDKPHVQYNAIMLIGILTDNPGPSFTKNCDKKFVTAVRDLLRDGPDASVQQILRETLDRLEVDKAYDRNLEPVFSMWRKEKGAGASFAGSRPMPRTLNAPPFDPNGPPPLQTFSSGSSHYARNQGRQRGLPAPVELAGRIEEARTSAKLLQQLVQSTPPEEILSHELIKEFAERCQSAQRSIQGYINCDDPHPDHDTLQTLIETNELLSLATSKHQRAVLGARRAAPDRGTSPYPTPAQNGTSTITAPTGAPQLPHVAPSATDEDDPTDVSYAAPDRRPTFPQPPAPSTISSLSNTTGNNNIRYASPPGPPPNHSSNNNSSSRYARAPAATAVELPSPVPASFTTTNAGTAASTGPTVPAANGDPFADVHSAPHPFEPVNYGAAAPLRAAPAATARGALDGKGVAENGQGRRGFQSQQQQREDDEDEADDEREERGRGQRVSGSVSSGVSPVETRPLAFRY
ncbi:MAG: hypothetical protein M1822_009140 [Bathelium mastoideum]|nr:MAG: hypothetical protein M1822_009140 [Bathelium mastoideum]